jgi:hypothetical protein
MDRIPETLKGDPEEIITRWNEGLLFREFTFSKNIDNRDPSNQHQFGDNLIWFEDNIILFQVKRRNKKETDFSSDEKEKEWFKDVVLNDAVGQITDNRTHLNTKGNIPLVNGRGESKSLEGKNIRNWIQVALFRPHLKYGAHNPTGKRFHMSTRTGFVHVITLYEYLEILTVLLTPGEIIHYFLHRQNLLTVWKEASQTLSERALLGHYISTQLPQYTNRSIYPSEDLANIVSSLQPTYPPILLNHLNKMGDGVVNETNDINRTGFHNLLTYFAKQKKVVFETLDELCDKAIQICIDPEFNNPERIGYKSMTFTTPFTGVGFSIIAINENDILQAPRMLQQATQATMYQLLVDEKLTILKHQIGIGFIKVPGDIRVFWTIHDYPPKDRLAKITYEKYLKQQELDSIVPVPYKFKPQLV